MIEDALKKVEGKESKIINRVLSLFATFRYLYLVRLPMDYPNRDKLIDEFAYLIKSLGITELFERTELNYSIKIMKESRYCKERPNWYSLYYVMR